MDEGEQLRLAIAAQSSLRGVVDDSVVEATIAALEERLATVEGRARPKRRKYITVLFADLTGSTELGEELDAEELSDGLDAIWRHLDAVIHRFGGQIDKHIGDAVMAMWGAEHGREDDPERAIRAALEMQSVLERLRGEGLAPSLAMRVGINSGPVVLGAIASTDEFTAIGDTVNVAARLEAAAAVGGVLVGHETYRHVRGVFRVRPQDPLTVKGKRAPLRTYLVDGVRPRAFRLPTRGIEGVETSMIGRARELRRLQEALTTTIDTSRASLVTVVGDAGIGKSRLLFEFEDWLRVRDGEVRLFTARADQGREGVPYSLLRDLLFSRFEIAEDDPGEIAQAKLTVGFRQLAGDDVAGQAPLVGHLVGIDAPDTVATAGAGVDARHLRSMGARAIGGLLARAASEMPVVMLLEDLHWADRASLDLLGAVQREMGGNRVLTVGLCRPQQLGRLDGWVLDSPDHERIVLEPLSGTDSGLLVDEVLQNVTAVPKEARDGIVDAAGGNPFFVEELVRMMIDEGVIVVGSDEWELRPDRLGELSIPPTVTGVIQARLDRLPKAELAVLQRASAVGAVFWDAAIPTVATSTGVVPPDIQSTLDALAARDLIERHDSSDFTGTAEYRFEHSILHDVTYESVLRQDLRPLHLEVAAWMATRGDGPVSASTVAGHYSAGGATTEAAQWFARAASQARLRCAVDEAIEASTRALEHDVLDVPTRLRVLDDLCESLSIAARYDEAREVAGRLAREAEDASDHRHLAVALMHQSHLHIRQGRSREALGDARRAHDLIRHSGASTDDLIDSMTEVAWVLLRLGHAREALAWGVDALGIVDTSTGVRLLRGVHSMMGAAHHTLGDYVDAADHIEHALELDRRRGDRRGEAANLVNLGEVARLQGDLDRSISMLEDALRIVRDIGDTDQEALVLSNLGGALVERGQVDDGVGHLQQAIRAFELSGATEHTSETHRFLAEAHLALGDLDAASTEAVIAMELARGDENPDHVGHAWRVLGLVAACRGSRVLPEVTDGLDADGCLATSVAVFADAGMERDRALALVDRSRTAAARGDATQARSLAEEARAVLVGLGLDALLARLDPSAATG